MCLINQKVIDHDLIAVDRGSEDGNFIGKGRGAMLNKVGM